MTPTALTASPLISGGSESCHDVLSGFGGDAQRREAVRQWVMGYFTGRLEADRSKQPELAELSDAIERIGTYCSRHEDEDIDAVAGEIYDHAASLKSGQSW
jgi:hypothetical protein